MDNAQIDTAIGEYKIPCEDEIIQAYVPIFEAHFERHYLSKGRNVRFTRKATAI